MRSALTWSSACARLAQAGLLINGAGSGPEFVVDGVTNDSRQAAPRSIFVAIKGHQVDGHDFIESAVSSGVSGIVCERMPRSTLQTNVVCVRSSASALAELSAAFHGDPAQTLHITGITGTNGKTTTTTLVHHVRQVTGTATGAIGTIAYRTGSDAVPASHTTPDAPYLQRLLREMVDSGMTACVLEVSSHALDQFRVSAIPFDVAVFTNLMHDHIQYHGTMERYLEAKKRLFDSLAPDAAAVYNLDDSAGPRIVADTRATTCSYGMQAQAAIRFRVLGEPDGFLRLRLDGLERQFRLRGHFNAYNLTAAYAAARASGMEQGVAMDALADAPPPPGRLETFQCEDGTIAVVDFAHTPDALEAVLTSLQPPTGALWCVFGCGGDRDRAKRPLMGAVAERLADHVIVTTDNPRSENPACIAHEILSGLAEPDAATAIPDRRAAIRHAARQCAAGDTVLIAGKGHESVQILDQRTVRFSDCEEVKHAFAHRAIMPTA